MDPSILMSPVLAIIYVAMEISVITVQRYLSVPVHRHLCGSLLGTYHSLQSVTQSLKAEPRAVGISFLSNIYQYVPNL